MMANIWEAISEAISKFTTAMVTGVKAFIDNADAYWFVGRENEAVYQWRHALVLKEDENILDKEKVQHKIDSGTADNTVLHLTNPEVLRNLQKIIKN